MGTTPNFNLTKPTDPGAPADLITIVGALADDTDAALGTHTHPYSPTGHTHSGLTNAQVRYNLNVPSDYVLPGASTYYTVPGLSQTIDGPCTVMVNLRLSYLLPTPEKVANYYARIAVSGSQSGSENGRIRHTPAATSTPQEYQVTSFLSLTLTAGQTVTFSGQCYMSNTDNPGVLISADYSGMTIFGYKHG